MWFSSTQPVEVLSALSAFFFSITTAAYGYHNLRTYTLLDALAPSYVWGLLYAIAAILQFIGLFSNESRIRAWGAGYAATLWAMTAISVWLSWPLAPHAGVFAALALSSLWALQRGLTDE